MAVSELLNLLIYGNQLKRTPRTGWLLRGIEAAEDVAAHSFGVAFTALAVAEVITEPLDKQRLLAMAVIHDLPEAITTDIPTPTWRFLPPGSKSDVERSAMQKITGDLPLRENLLDYWEELQERKTAESLLVNDCDKLDMYLQALMYEQQTGNRQLVEFWENDHQFAFAETQILFDELASLRQKE